MFFPRIRWSCVMTVCKACSNRLTTCIRVPVCKSSYEFNFGYSRKTRPFGWNTNVEICRVNLKQPRLFGHKSVNRSYLIVGYKPFLQFNQQYLFRTFSWTNPFYRKERLQETSCTNTTFGPSDKNNDIKDIKEKIVTIPNLLTVSRIIATPFLGYLVVQNSYPLALGIFCVAGFTDILDGYIARKFHQKTVLGSALDPLADKLLVSVLTVTLTLVNLIPLPLAIIILGRDVLLIAASLYLRYISLPPPKTLSRYCDVTNATIQLHPSVLSKINTFLQLTLLASSLAAPVFDFVDHIALQILWVLTGTTTVASGLQYYITRNESVQFLQDKMKRKL